MKKTLRILAVAIFGLMLFQHCQKSDFLVVTGVVRDSLTNQPLEGIYIFTENGSARTAQDGTFSLNGIQAGKQYINAFSFSKYNQQSKSIIITNGQINKVDFKLSRIPEPEVETGSVFDIKINSAKITSSINVKSGSVNQYGHCWSSKSSDPTLNDMEDFTNHGAGGGKFSFTSNLPNLQSEKLYYVRAYATTNEGTIYGNTVVFRPSDKDIFTGLLAYYTFNSFTDAHNPWWNYGYFFDESGNYSWLYSYQWIVTPLTQDRFGVNNRALKCESPTYTYTSSWLFSSFYDFSISFWVKKDSWAGTDKPILNFGYWTYQNEIRIGEDASQNKLYFNIKTSSGSSYKLAPNSAPSLDKWHHLVFLREGNSLRLYMNGVLQNSKTCDNSVINAGGYFFAGFDIDPLFWNWKYFNGALDDIRIYNRALNQSEVTYLFRN